MALTNGYHTLAHFLDLPPNVPVLRRFGSLNLLNLLYMQAELVHLESQLRCIAREDAESGDLTRREFAHSATLLQESAAGAEDFQWSKILEIREKLEIYSTPFLSLSLSYILFSLLSFFLSFSALF